LFVTLVIAAVLLLAGIPSFIDWIRNTQIRAAAESFLSGIQLARAEAVRRNTLVRFQVTDTLTTACSLSTTGANWVVSLSDVTSACDITSNSDIMQIRPQAEGAGGTVVSATQATLVFNGLGRLTPVPASNVAINIAGSSGTCLAASGSLRCLRIVVSPSGQVLLCDPDPNLAAGHPATCP
jgi:type IV fimbrial biogenesis protein FimT